MESSLILSMPSSPSPPSAVNRENEEHKAKPETATVAILPLPKSIQYSNRPTSHLQMKEQILTPISLSPVTMTYLEGSKQMLRKESLYGFSNYQGGFEGSVTHAWIAILNSVQTSTHMVLDGGMNTGFYTLLSAVMGYSVHSFELQLDCFDVSRKLLDANNVDANLYHIGLGEGGKVLEVGEGCDPGYGVLQGEKGVRPKGTGTWVKRKHNVGLVALDSFLDQKRQDKQVALLKLDVEGAEIVALQGLVRHRPFVENIILECAKHRLLRYTGVDDIKREFRQLQADGYTPYKLYSEWMGASVQRWHDIALLDSTGLRQVDVHPIIKAPIAEDSTTILWEVVDWDRFFLNGPNGCNILFHRNRT